MKIPTPPTEIIKKKLYWNILFLLYVYKNKFYTAPKKAGFAI